MALTKDQLLSAREEHGAFHGRPKYQPAPAKVVAVVQHAEKAGLFKQAAVVSRAIHVSRRPVCGTRGRAPRSATNHRVRGSRRARCSRAAPSRAAPDGSDLDGDSDQPGPAGFVPVHVPGGFRAARGATTGPFTGPHIAAARFGVWLAGRRTLFDHERGGEVNPDG